MPKRKPRDKANEVRKPYLREQGGYEPVEAGLVFSDHLDEQVEAARMDTKHLQGSVVTRKSDGRKFKASVYSKELADQVLIRISNGMTPTHAAQSLGISPWTVWSWRRKDYDGFAEKLQAAQEDCADFLVDEILDIADDKSGDTRETEQGTKVDYENIQRSKIRIDARKWIASVVNPKRYGEKLQVDNTHKLLKASDTPETIELAKNEWKEEFGK